MKIIDERKPNVNFEEIEDGNCFFSDGELMMKIFSATSEDNAFSLVSGTCYHFGFSEKVTPVDVEIYICK